MWIKGFDCTLINIDVASELTINKIDSIYELVVKIAESLDITLCQSTKINEIFEVFDYIQAGIANDEKLIDIKKFINENGLTFTVEPIEVWKKRKNFY